MQSEFPIKFFCPHCNIHLAAKHNVAGKTVICPKCEKALEVPSESEASDTSKMSPNLPTEKKHLASSTMGTDHFKNLSKANELK